VVPRELSSEHRFVPLAVDINRDLAVTAFLCRLPPGPRAGQPGLETSQFQRRGGIWAYLGGGAAEFRDYPLAERPQEASQGGYLRALGYGQTCLTEPHRFPWNARYAFHAMLRASAEVHRLKAGTRVLDVPFHGHAVLIWANRRGPTVAALAPDGTCQATIELRGDPFEARRRRIPAR
jgi:hypothetical protein